MVVKVGQGSAQPPEDGREENKASSPQGSSETNASTRFDESGNGERANGGLFYSILSSDAMTRRLCDIIATVAMCLAIIVLPLALFVAMVSAQTDL
jgi:hypothetical protein